MRHVGREYEQTAHNEVSKEAKYYVTCYIQVGPGNTATSAVCCDARINTFRRTADVIHRPRHVVRFAASQTQ